MWLIIDDKRTFGCEIIARTAQAGKFILSKLVKWVDAQRKPVIECLCIDHDLGLDDETGYDVIKWAIEHNCLPKHVQIVSQNPIGKANIASVLLREGYKTINQTDYKLND